MRREQHTTLQVILCDSCFSVVDIEEELLGWDEWEAIDGLCCRIDEILGDMVMAQVSPCEDMEDKYEDVRRKLCRRALEVWALNNCHNPLITEDDGIYTLKSESDDPESDDPESDQEG
jgi:hypothetical protein